MSLLFSEDLSNSPGIITGPGTLVGDLVAPGKGLTVEVLQGGKGTGGEEALTDV